MSSDDVTVVVPARDAAATLAACLDSLVPRVGRELSEVVVVDDGSTDATGAIARARGARVVRTPGRGPGAARNAGLREVRTPLVWFVDADCVARCDALEPLRRGLAADGVVGVGGTYANLFPNSWLATCIHEEIAARHRAMACEVDFLATFNVLYRCDALEKVGGFDERFLMAEDGDLAYRLLRAGGRLRFERGSVVGHHHPTRLRAYLRTQRRQGYWRVWLYFAHPGRISGDSYSGLLDHLQPPLALLVTASAPLVLLPGLGALPAVLVLALLAASLPLAVRLARRSGRPALLAFAPFAALRAFARAAGMTQAVLAVLAGRGSSRAGRGRRAGSA